MSSSPVFRQSCLLFLICIAASFVKAYNDHQPPVAPPTNFTPGPDISFDRFFTIDTAQLAAPPGFTGGDCNISPSSLVQNGTVTVILPPTINDNNTDSFEDIHTQTLMVSLPYLFEQIGVQEEEIPKLVERGIPLFAAAVKESLCPTQSGSLARRSIFGDIADLIEDLWMGATVDVACSIFAASALPGYLTFAGLLHAQNIRQIPIASTPDQDFFIFPLHGAISHNDGISIFYSANLPPSTLGLTIGRNIYVRQSADTRFMENGGFPTATRILLHEFTHSKQYQRVGYSLAAFGTQYLFNFCKVSSHYFSYLRRKPNPMFSQAGFSYSNNVMERDAFMKQELMDSLLFDPIGFQFATIWKKKNLGATLGLPTARSFTLLFSSSGFRIFALPMQRGRMTIVCVGSTCF